MEAGDTPTLRDVWILRSKAYLVPSCRHCVSMSGKALGNLVTPTKDRLISCDVLCALRRGFGVWGRTSFFHVSGRGATHRQIAAEG